jgi:hypothetical protein
MWTDPAEVFAAVADRLRAGVASAGHPFHWPAVATTGDGGRPQSRIVVLRAFDPDRRTVEFHTDGRSPKVRHLAADPRLCLLFHDPAGRVQVKLTATAALHAGDADAKAAWDRLNPGSRAAYAAAHPPGTVLPADADTRYPPADEAAFGQFVLVVCHISEIEYLELRPDGHRRARLSWRTDWVADRLAP